ncbi:GntR family transcriptional regulator [Maritimibacter sp. 55A14]|uniref:GntR family transcriptional regulator n=1 Tax=Maritimibacter sp. 55A14 TaxID=2174844 RepID=UPI000D61C851|nr:GntR family transcriptional regulator [Maritimibacter sp. 55A14]PWE33254.1 GntR family transcriptional regulator [Maritimibacter sp. 55A14]
MSTPRTPAHEVIYARIRDMILFGDLAPGQPVTLHGLVDRMGVSTTPVREAVRRLGAEGALERLGNRRIVVPVLDAGRLDELEFARLAIEPRLAEMATPKVGHTEMKALQDADAALDSAIRAGDTPGYMRQNYRFHFTLYRAANAQVLLPIAEALWLQYGPLGRVICGRFGTGRMADRHKETLAALAQGDAGAAARAIAADIRQGFTLMRDGMRTDENLIKSD